ncbi:putative protease [uncultured Mediterranean phage uvDeep-CGR2-AD3-C191]|nr:putative protease [uncultured Mediterranean phage uvDeep-CGR2-AD3-C191]
MVGEIAEKEESTSILSEPSPETAEEQSTEEFDGAEWKSALTDELRDNPSIQQVDDIQTLAKGYVDSQSYIGGAVRVPGEDASSEDWAEFYNKAGRPESSDKYEIEVPEGAEAEFGYRTDLEDNFKASAHDLGLSQRQVQGLVDWQLQKASEANQDITESRRTSDAELRANWGKNYDRNMWLAKRAVSELAEDEAAQQIIQSPLGNAPGVIRLFQRVGQMLYEDGYMDGQAPGGVSAEEAQSKINAIFADSEHPYHDADAKGHDDAIAEMQRLFQITNPE